MHKPIQKYISLCALISMSMIDAADVAPLFVIRSQGFNSVLRVPSQTYNHVHLPNYGDNGCGPAYGSFWLTGEYTRSFRGYDIAKSLFGDAINNNHCMQIQGSQVAGRNANALLADYFYLPTDFNSCVCFSPRIQNVILDANYYVGMDNIWKGFYFAMEAPLTWSKWALNIRENVQNAGVNSDSPGYFTAGALARSALNEDFSSFALGNAPGTITQVSNDAATQQTTTQLLGLQFAKMRKSSTRTTVSELRYYLGWNFLLKDDYHMGFHLEASAPTGNRPHAEWLFEPQNGNGKHTEFGAGIHGHYTFSRSQDENSSWTFEAALDVTHLFKAHQTRTFDLNDLPLSRYMSVLQMTENVVGLVNAGGTAPSAQFANLIQPLANITTFDVDVSVGAQLDLIAFFRYEKNQFMCGEGKMTWDFGYNLYYRSCENIELRCGCNQFAANTWALKGDAQVYGFSVSAGGTPTVLATVPLSATESEATINAGTNFGANGVVNPPAILTAQQNPNIDNPALAFSGGLPLRTLFEDNNTNATNPQINSSFNPVFIQQSDINFVRNRQLTNKLFSKWQFTFTDRETWIPYMGCGFEVEFAQTRGDDCNSCDDNNDCNNDCDSSCEDVNGSCLRGGLSQWGIFANIGISYQ
jgi:hypothetical protein